MEKFRGVDYYGIEGLLSEEERMIRDAVRDWVEAEFLPLVTEHHRAGTFPVSLIPKLGELGVFGATLKGYGCAGLNNVAYGLIMQELERGDSGLRSAASVQSGLVMHPIYTYGSDAQKEKWLPEMARGAKIGCFGLTEPDYGSDPGGMKTRARRQGDAYVLNGTKLWITNGSIADVAVVWAKEDDGEIYGYLVERGTPGFSTIDIHGKFSMRASITSELSFQDCRIPLENKFPKVKGLRGPLGCLNQARYGIAWGAVVAVRPAAHPVRQADRLVPARPAEAGLDDHRDHQGPAPLPAARPAQGRGPGASAAGLHGEDEQRADGVGHSTLSARCHGGRRNRGRAPGDSPYDEPGDREYL
jgi:glutaryl-CoA dehydrogenase